MSITTENMDIREYDVTLMAHLGEDAQQFAFTAMWVFRFPGSFAIRGCPVGNGATPDAAGRDLVARTNRESGTKFQLSQDAG